jgi:hypothetical protein
VESNVIPAVAQMALIGTVGFSSVTSTAFLHLVASPYVVALYEIKSPPTNEAPSSVPTPTLSSSDFSSSSSAVNRKFIAVTCDVFGRLKESPFSMSEAIKPAVHPFASFLLKKQDGSGKKKNLYIFGRDIQDMEIRTRLTKE